MSDIQGFLRLKQIVPDIIPVSPASWWNGVKKGIYPKPLKLGPRTTVWAASDILDLVERFKKQG